MKVVYELGEVVEIRDNTCGHGFYYGEHVRIKSLDGDYVETAEYLDGNDFWYLDEDDIQKIEESK